MGGKEGRKEAGVGKKMAPRFGEICSYCSDGMKEIGRVKVAGIAPRSTVPTAEQPLTLQWLSFESSLNFRHYHWHNFSQVFRAIALLLGGFH